MYTTTKKTTAINQDCQIFFSSPPQCVEQEKKDYRNYRGDRSPNCTAHLEENDLITNVHFQFVVTPSNLEKPIKLQLPIMLATYPFRNEDGTLRRKQKIEYPATLPIFRPWLDEKTFQWTHPHFNLAYHGKQTNVASMKKLQPGEANNGAGANHAGDRPFPKWEQNYGEESKRSSIQPPCPTWGSGRTQRHSSELVRT